MTETQQQTADAPTDNYHDEWALYNHDDDNQRPCDSRKDAEERKAEVQGLADEELSLEIFAPGESPYDGNGDGTVPCAECGDGVTPAEAVYGPQNEPYHNDCHDETDADESEGEPVDAEIVDHDSEKMHQQNFAQSDMAAARSMQDPLSTLPGWMITEVSYSDRGDTTTTVNKRGCQVIASYLNLEYETDDTTRASDTDFEYAEFECTVTKPDGRTFTGHGTAKADGDDQNEGDGWKLDMLAETRAFKRAVKGATGGGIEAFAREQDAPDA